MLHAYFYTLPSCDTTVNKLQTALDGLKLALQASQDYTQIIILQRDNKAAEAEARKQKEINKDAIHKSELKNQRNRGRKEGAGGVGIIAVILLVLAL